MGLDFSLQKYGFSKNPKIFFCENAENPKIFPASCRKLFPEAHQKNASFR